MYKLFNSKNKKVTRNDNLLLKSIVIFTMLFVALLWTTHASAVQVPSLDTLQVGQNTQWTVFTGCLVFFMNSGFAMLESGFCRSSNAITVLAKNLIVFAIATLSFWVLGFGFMFGDGSPFVGINGFLLQSFDNYQKLFPSLDWANIPLTAKFFFQLTFAGTTATIVSGAVAERMKFSAFMIFSFFLVLSYSITGHWIWGGGFLDTQQLHFKDFAGSTVVHSVGGWAALMGVVLLKPRLGKYRKFKPHEKLSRNEISFYNKKIVVVA